MDPAGGNRRSAALSPLSTHVDALLRGATTALVLLAVIGADAVNERRQAS